MANELTALASTTGTPWAISDAALTNAYAAWAGTTAVSKETSVASKAATQSLYEIASQGLGFVFCFRS